MTRIDTMPHLSVTNIDDTVERAIAVNKARKGDADDVNLPRTARATREESIIDMRETLVCFEPKLHNERVKWWKYIGRIYM